MRTQTASLCLCLLLAGAAQAKDEKLVPAQFQSKNDSLGERWDVDSRGNLQVMSVGQVHQLLVNGVNFNSEQRLMTADGAEYVFKGKCGNLVTTRRVKVQDKFAGVRMVDIVENPGSSPLEVTFTEISRINMMPNPTVSDQGTPVNQNLGKKDSGIVVQTAAQVTLLYGLVGRGGKSSPTISKQHNYELRFDYRVKIPAKGRAALVLNLAKVTGTPGQKQIEQIYRDFHSPKYTRDLPREVRARIVNTRAGGAPGGETTLASLEEELGLAGATLDVLAFGPETRVRGTAHCQKLEIDSGYGKAEIPFEQIAAMAGGAYKSGQARLHFKDGQKLSGKMLTDGLRFEMTTGLSVDLRVDRLDRLVIRKAREQSMPPPGRLLVETQAGDRLMVKSPAGAALGLATRWGVRRVPLERVKSLARIGEGQPGFWVTLTDKSHFRAFFSDAQLELESELFGPVRFTPAQVRAIVSADAIRRPGRDQEDDGEILQPFLTLVGGDIIVGQIDLPAVHFAGTGEVLPVPPTQIRNLNNSAEGEAPEFGEAVEFKAELWGGGEVAGVLREALLPVQTGDGKVWIPARELLSAQVPTPQIPPALRQRIAALIRELASPSWEKREAATRELRSLGALARLPLEETRSQTRDPEVERRVKELLAAIEEE
ncbi:MAG: hypothetical protein AB7N76_14070 [Planctomycetota bacterium]